MHHPSVSWHIIPLKCSSWNNICFGQKEPIKIQFFRLWSALMKLNPTPHAIFETTRSRFIQIFHYCSVSWKITPLYFFSSKRICFGQKEPIKIQFFRLLSALMKLHPTPHAIFETTRSRFIQIFHYCSL